MSEAPVSDTTHNNFSFEVDQAALEVILQPDRVLATQALDRKIAEAEAASHPDGEQLALFRLQRSLIDMEAPQARNAARDFARQTGKYATFASTFGHRPPSLHYPLIREMFIADFANEERWRTVGIDPSVQFGDDPYGNAHKKGIEQDWREARETREALAKAQAAEAAAMDRVINPPVFEPRQIS